MEAIDASKNTYRHECPSCAAKLRIPSRAIGHSVNCPSCRAPFAVPRPQEDIDELVSEWIQDDVDEMWSKRDDQVKQQIAREREEAARAAAHRAKIDALVAEQTRSRRTTPPTPRPTFAGQPGMTAAVPASRNSVHGMHQMSNVIAA